MTAGEIRKWSANHAGSPRAVRLRAVVTYPALPSPVFVQDSTGAVSFSGSDTSMLEPGDEVEIQGELYMSLYMAAIRNASFVVVRKNAMPTAVPVKYDDLLSGRYHYQWIAFEGVVRSTATVEDGRAVMRIAAQGKEIEVKIKDMLENGPQLLDARVRIEGIAFGRINNRKQLVEPYLCSNGWDNVTVLAPAREIDEVPFVPTDRMLTFDPAGNVGHRVRLNGSISAAFPDGIAYLEDDRGAVSIQLLDGQQVSIGDRVEVVGFPEMGVFSGKIVNAAVLSNESGARPVPLEKTVPELIEKPMDAQLVAVTGRLAATYSEPDGAVFILADRDRTVRAKAPTGTEKIAAVGSLVRVVGVCEVGRSRMVASTALPESLRLRVQLAGDIQVKQAPTWWTLRRLSILAGGLCMILVCGAAWIIVLRLQVRRRTEALRDQLAREAALIERQHLAREFHDRLEQDLTGIGLQLSAAMARGLEGNARPLVESSRRLVDRVSAETRMLVSELRCDKLGDGRSVDLMQHLRLMVEGRECGIGPSVRLETNTVEWRVSAQLCHQLQMLAAEAITNALKHANATTIRVTAEKRADLGILAIEDDGCGFDPISRATGWSGHFGCMGMRERCLKIGATVEWRSEIGRGTRVEIRIAVPDKGASNAGQTGKRSESRRASNMDETL